LKKCKEIIKEISIQFLGLFYPDIHFLNCCVKINVLVKKILQLGFEFVHFFE